MRIFTPEHRLKLKQNHARPMLGKKFSSETKRKMSIAQKLAFKNGKTVATKGTHLSKETREKISLSKIGKKRPDVSGNNNWNWKGGITPEDKVERIRFRNEISPEVFKRDNYKCSICGKGGYLQAHHIKDWSKFPSLRFDINNCQTLCMACHYKITFGREIPKGKMWGQYGI